MPASLIASNYPLIEQWAPAMPASLIASNYPLIEQWAPLVVFGKRAPLWRKLRGQPNAMKTNSRKCQTALARPQLEPAGFSQLVLVLDLNADCCYHRLSVATVLPSYSYQRPLAKKTAGWFCKFSAREEVFTRTSQQPLTGSHRWWTCFEQAGTNGTPT